MLPSDQLLLTAAILVIIGILASKLSSRFGVPALVLFLGLGMLAGSEGIGRIEFEDYELASALGTTALALILFDGGLATSTRSLRAAWAPAALLATLGVAATALLTGLAAAWILGVPLIYGLLLGSIIGSTDAAAVFSILRKQGLHLKERLAATLEVESGSNDPMAVFLTIGLAEVALGRLDLGAGLLQLFAMQMSIGAAIGLLVGGTGVLLINRVRLDAAGLYPVLASGIAMLAFGLAAVLGGSGFLSVYLAGIVLGNQRLIFQRGILMFHDAAAWIAQIVMFVLLGLLTFPTSLMAVADKGLLVALVLTFVARPAMVFLTMLPFGFNWRELTLLSWVGLKGAVPIILAIYPLLLGLEHGQLLFDVVFFVVLVSALTQGWSLPALTRRLGLEEPRGPEPPATLEISALRRVDADIVEYALTRGSRAVKRKLKELPLPEGVLVALVARGQRLVPPRGGLELLEGDHVFIIADHDARPLVDHVFAAPPLGDVQLPNLVEFQLRASTTAAALETFYGLRFDTPPQRTLAELLEERLGRQPEQGDDLELGRVRLVVRGMEGSQVERVGVAILPPDRGELRAAAE